MNHIPEGKIEDTAAAWEIGGTLGNDEAFVAVAEDISSAVDESLGLHPISIRLHKDLLDKLKALAQVNNIGYQPLIRQVLTRFVDCEIKAIIRDKHAREVKERAEAEAAAAAAEAHCIECGQHREAA